MPKQKTDDLIQLIRSLTRAEKRHFRLFVRRNQATEEILFLQLFDFLDKHKDYDENLVLKKIPEIKKTQLSNLKAHLYKQLLISLRLLNKNFNEDIQLRETIDHAKVLYDKGLYRQALDTLEKSKEKAKRECRTSLALEMVEFEKHIEGQYITRSIAGRAEELAKEARILSKELTASHEYSNLALQLYGLYLKVGFARNKKDHFFVDEFIKANQPSVDFAELDFIGKIHFCQSYLWYHHILQDFPRSYKYAQRWCDLFANHPGSIQLYAPLYLKGLHNLLSSLFNMLQYPKFIQALKELDDFPILIDLKRSKNMESLFHLYKYIHAINKHYLQGTFTEGLKMIPELEKVLITNKYGWDDHRILVFYYRIACLYFGSGDNSLAITYLNKIINQKNPDYRGDIQCFARILNLIAHFEMGNAQLVEYQVKSVYRFLSKMEELHAVQSEIFRFIRRTPNISEKELKQEFLKLKHKLEVLARDPYERRSFMYLDIISWLESKIEGLPVQEVIRAKFLASASRTK